MVTRVTENHDTVVNIINLLHFFHWPLIFIDDVTFS